MGKGRGAVECARIMNQTPSRRLEITAISVANRVIGPVNQKAFTIINEIALECRPFEPHRWGCDPRNNIPRTEELIHPSTSAGGAIAGHTTIGNGHIGVPRTQTAAKVGVIAGKLRIGLNRDCAVLRLYATPAALRGIITHGCSLYHERAVQMADPSATPV